MPHSLLIAYLVQKYYNRIIAPTKPGEVKNRSVKAFWEIDSTGSSMIKHYILSLNPTAKHEWDRCILRDPLTAKRPEIAKLIAEAVAADTGSYLVSVNIEVKVLEQATVSPAEQLSLPFPEASVPSPMREAA
jgi:hypothetical protein